MAAGAGRGGAGQAGAGQAGAGQAGAGQAGAGQASAGQASAGRGGAGQAGAGQAGAGQASAGRDSAGAGQAGACQGGGVPRELAVGGFTDGRYYHDARPDYPMAAVDYLVSTLGIGPQSHVLDLAAGTGIFTGQILAHCGRVTAVEPSDGMRQVLAARLPGVEVLDGRDTAIPLAGASVDAVTVAQAFHWFDAPQALAEIHRVLVPGGGLGLVWNEIDESVGWVAEYSAALRWPECQPYPVGMDFTPVIASGPFCDVECRQFEHVQVMDRAGLLRRAASTSYVAVMGEQERRALVADVARVAERLPEPISLPYVTTAYRATARTDC
ncbi:MAG: class I SAM-dependent methyltransferase [Actinomycetota bacterium]|nr:class I SAM-dependent methyltransferase [Actinomycetota bacterium]